MKYTFCDQIKYLILYYSDYSRPPNSIRASPSLSEANLFIFRRINLNRLLTVRLRVPFCGTFFRFGTIYTVKYVVNKNGK